MKAMEILEVGLRTKSGPAIAIEGPAGCGKTRTIVPMVRQMGGECYVFNGATISAVTFDGIPFPDNGRLVKWPDKRILQANERAKNGEFIVIFVDEATRMEGEVQNALLKAIDEGVVGDFELSKEIKWVLGHNPGDWPGCRPFHWAVHNRLLHIQWGRYTIKERKEYLLAGGMGTDSFNWTPTEKPSDTEWNEAYGKVIGAYCRFLESFPEHREENPKEIEGRHPMAYCTDRSWEYALRLLSTAIAMKKDLEIQAELLTGMIGEPATMVFLEFLNSLDLPTPKEILQNPSIIKHEETRYDRTYVAVTSFASFIVNEPGKPNWEKAWEIMKTWIETGFPKGILAIAAKTLIVGRDKNAKIIGNKNIEFVAKELHSFNSLV